MIEGKLSPDQGSFIVGETVKLAIVDQEREGLSGNLDQTVFDEITEGKECLELGSTEINSRAYCSWFGFKVFVSDSIGSNISVVNPLSCRQ